MTSSEAALNDEELVKKLREVTSGKLFFTNTPNHLRLTAADRIEQLLKRNKELECELESVYYDISMNATIKEET